MVIKRSCHEVACMCGCMYVVCVCRVRPRQLTCPVKSPTSADVVWLRNWPKPWKKEHLSDAAYTCAGTGDSECAGRHWLEGTSAEAREAEVAEWYSPQSNATCRGAFRTSAAQFCSFRVAQQHREQAAQGAIERFYACIGGRTPPWALHAGLCAFHAQVDAHAL